MNNEQKKKIRKYLIEDIKKEVGLICGKLVAESQADTIMKESSEEDLLLYLAERKTEK